MRNVSATQVIRDAHKRLRGLFEQVEAIPDRAPEMKNGIYLEIMAELLIHIRTTSEYFYPAIKATSTQTGLGAISDGFLSHRASMQLLQRLRKVKPGMPQYSEIFDDLIDEVTVHMEDEERGILRQAEELLSAEQLLKLGEQMQKRRTELLKSPELAAAHPQRVQNPHGGEQKRKRTAA
ncbi:MAG: hypothetical protein A3K03_06185 [Bdellovibrionales bacterium RIFOXYD1_FULL_44_7]|nr:MAG: hypothetical protein A3K03_06185 [Bdellovibrionales bacterium RIFOXYD1_FULL_44_7]